MKSAFSSIQETDVEEIPDPPTHEDVKRMVKEAHIQDGDTLLVQILMIRKLWRRDFGLMVQEATHEALDERGLFDVQVAADLREIDMYETQEAYHGKVNLIPQRSADPFM